MRLTNMCVWCGGVELGCGGWFVCSSCHFLWCCCALSMLSPLHQPHLCVYTCPLAALLVACKSAAAAAAVCCWPHAVMTAAMHHGSFFCSAPCVRCVGLLLFPPHVPQSGGSRWYSQLVPVTLCTLCVTACWHVSCLCVCWFEGCCAVLWRGWWWLSAVSESISN